MSSQKNVGLTKCMSQTNCEFQEWEFKDVNKKFNQLIEIASCIPRTTILEQDENYWHGVCRSLIFRFPDDLEILKLRKGGAKGIIQIRSASRYGASDLGVNRQRIEGIYKRLLKEESDKQIG